MPPGTIDVRVPSDSPVVVDLSGPPELNAPPEGPHRGRRLVGPRRRTVLIMGISAAALLTLSSIAILFVRWVRSEDANVLIVVFVAPEWEGATVTVTGPQMANDLTDTFTEKKPGLRFHVPPGAYTVRVERAGKVLATRTTAPDQPLKTNMIWWPFHYPVTAPAQKSEPR